MLKHLWYSIQRTLVSHSLKKLVRRLPGEEYDPISVWDGVRSLMVCWPGGGMDLIAARVVLNRVRERFPEAALTVVALPGVGASPPPEVDAEVLAIQREDLTLLGLPGRRLRERLAGSGYDTAVDLSPRFDPLSAYLCIASGARLRIGFAAPNNELIYNYQVAPRSERTGIDRYRVLARYLG